MKTSAMFWVGATTLVVLIVTIIAALSFPFSWVFFATLAGQLMLGYTVYRVLTDEYSTDKTFDHFYEDHPIR